MNTDRAVAVGRDKAVGGHRVAQRHQRVADPDRRVHAACRRPPGARGHLGAERALVEVDRLGAAVDDEVRGRGREPLGDGFHVAHGPHARRGRSPAYCQNATRDAARRDREHPGHPAPARGPAPLPPHARASVRRPRHLGRAPLDGRVGPAASRTRRSCSTIRRSTSRSRRRAPASTASAPSATARRSPAPAASSASSSAPARSSRSTAARSTSSRTASCR